MFLSKTMHVLWQVLICLRWRCDKHCDNVGFMGVVENSFRVIGFKNFIFWVPKKAKVSLWLTVHVACILSKYSGYACFLLWFLTTTCCREGVVSSFWFHYGKTLCLLIWHVSVCRSLAELKPILIFFLAYQWVIIHFLDQIQHIRMYFQMCP